MAETEPTISLSLSPNPPIILEGDEQAVDERRDSVQPSSLPEIKQTKPSSFSDNPFQVPNDDEIFAIRERERQNKNEEKDKLRTMSIYEKSSKKRENYKILMEDQEDLNGMKALAKRKGRELFLLKKQMGDRQFSKETLQEFVGKKREMFLVQYALGVKKEEMKKLEEIVQAEEQKLLDDEKALEEDAAKFDAFLKENDKNSVEAMKKAEGETKAKLEKIQEIKKLNTQIINIRSEMSKNEDQLKDYQRYREFLEKLTPQEWLKERQQQKKTKEIEKKKNQPEQAKAASQSKKKKSTKTKEGESKIEDDDDDSIFGNDSDLDEEAPLYFSSPQQLLEIFSELEETNLSLIQNAQEMEETLEELRRKSQETDQNMKRSTEGLKQQIEFLETAIKKEEEKSRMLEERAKVFSNGLSGGEMQDKQLEELTLKVREVYQTCVGDFDGNIGILQMLTAIENKLENLFEQIELMPADKVEQAEKMKEKERRQRIREEKMDAQRQLQEERVQRALERAKAPVKKKTGKPIVFRSAPPQMKKRQTNETKKKEEDVEFYFAE